MSEPVLYVDQTSGATGTALAAAQLNTAVPAASYLAQGTTPSPPGSGLVLTYAQQQGVIQNNTAGVDNGSGTQFVTLAASTLTVSASRDTYVDLNTNGTLTLTAYANGATPSPQGNNTLRLWKVVSNASQITGVVLLAPANPVSNAMLPPNVSVTSLSTSANVAVGTSLTVSNGGLGVTGSSTLSAPVVNIVPNASATGAGSYALGVSNPNFGGGYRWNIAQLSNGNFAVAKDTGGAQTNFLVLDGSGDEVVASGSITAGTGLTVSAGGAAISGNSSVAGTFSANGTTVTTIHATGAATLDSTLAVTGTTTFTGATTHNGGLVTSTLQANGAATLSGGISGNTTITGKLLESTSAPTLTPNANLGSTGSASFQGASTDTFGYIHLTAGGTGIAAGSLCQVTYSSPWPTAGYPTISPGDAATQALGLYVPLPSSNSFTIACANAPSAGSYLVTYVVKGK